MNREFAKSLRLRDFSKPYNVGIPGYAHGLVINHSDRQYEVVGPSWRFVQWLPEEHVFPAIIRDDRHVNKYARGPAKVIELGKVN